MADRLEQLINELCKLPAETGCIEFKENNWNPQDVGEYLSALSNTAALKGAHTAYVVWGIRNVTHEIVGTDFHPTRAKGKGDEALESWLTRQLTPRIYFQFHEVECGGFPVVLLEIPRAPGIPVQFQGIEFIRVGSHRQKLKDHPHLERALWRSFDDTPFERVVAAERIDSDEVLRLLDYKRYFSLLGLSLPRDRDGILERLVADQMIAGNSDGTWDITNLGAILFASDIDVFPRLKRKAVRVVVYQGTGRQVTRREQEGHRGYAAGFSGVIKFIDNLVPRNEVVKDALRSNVPMYPEDAIRELVANALIHQDFGVTGAGPMIEIFDDRVEITNPGVPLVKTERFLDMPPRSRNETLASFMRRAGICEERGSGIDKVVSLTEFYQLPAPIFESLDESTRAVLFAHKPMREMSRDDRIRACYLHACLRYVQRELMTNSSLRERFGIEEKNSAVASRIIGDTLEEGLIERYDAEQGRKYAKYVPFWAGPRV